MTFNPDQVRVAQLYSRDVMCELRVNDIPVLVGQEGLMENAAKPIRQFTVEGQNRLELRCGNPAAEPQKGGWSGMAWTKGRVADFWDGETMSEDGGSLMAELEPELGEDTPNPTRAMATYSSTWGGDWAWTQAPLIDPVGQRGQLDAMMAWVIARFAARDMDSLVPLYEPAIRDRVAAYPVLSIEGQINMTRAWLSDTDAETWEVEPFDPANAVYRPAADGRMVQPLGQDGHPLIRSVWMPPEKEGGRETYESLPLLIGLYKNELRFLV
ncbi:MAG: hypothetical protein AAFY03_09215 [Pseudomonadota bacterium]